MATIPYFRARGRNKLKPIGPIDPILLEKTAFNCVVRFLKSSGFKNEIDQLIVAQLHDARVAMLELVPEVIELVESGSIAPSEVSLQVDEYISNRYSAEYVEMNIINLSVFPLRTRTLRIFGKYLNVDMIVRAEMKLYELFKDSRRKYASQVRSLAFNMGKKETGLLQRIMTGDVLPESMALMDRRAMWPNFWSRPENQPGRRIIMIRREDELQSDEQTMLKCSKCKQWKVKYFEFQTRSADEPMTVYCECMSCGHRWKM